MYETQTGVRRRSWRFRILSLLALVLVFFAGLWVGQGHVSFHKTHPVSSNLPNRLDYSQVDKVYKSLIDNYDGKLTEAQLEDGLKHGLATAAHDPYTVYFTPKEAKEFNDQLNNSFSGIGA